MNNEEVIVEKVKSYSSEGKAIHLDMENGRHYNGYVRIVTPNYFILDDFKIGEVICFFIEILVVEPYKPKGKEKEEIDPGRPEY